MIDQLLNTLFLIGIVAFAAGFVLRGVAIVFGVTFPRYGV